MNILVLSPYLETFSFDPWILCIFPLTYYTVSDLEHDSHDRIDGPTARAPPAISTYALAIFS